MENPSESTLIAGDLQERFRPLKTTLLEAVRTFYGTRLVSLLVFGSAARVTQHQESDLDVMVIAEDLPRRRLLRTEEFLRVEEALEPLLQSLSREGTHTRISPVVKSPEEALRGSPLFLDMIEDAQVLYDRDGFIQGVFDRMKERLRALGAKRVWRGNAWHWDLKPDYMPGEVFEL